MNKEASSWAVSITREHRIPFAISSVSLRYAGNIIQSTFKFNSLEIFMCFALTFYVYEGHTISPLTCCQA